MKLTPTAAVNYLRNFGLGEKNLIRVPVTEEQHDGIVAALRKAGIFYSWVPIDIRDEGLKPLFEEIARMDAAINMVENFPKSAEGESEWFIYIFSRQLGVTHCLPRPTQKLFDCYVRRSPGLRPRNVLANP